MIRLGVEVLLLPFPVLAVELDVGDEGIECGGVVVVAVGVGGRGEGEVGADFEAAAAAVGVGLAVERDEEQEDNGHRRNVDDQRRFAHLLSLRVT